MLSERIEKWQQEFIARGRAEGHVEGRAEGQAEGEARGRVEGESRGRAKGEADMLLRLCVQKLGELPEEAESIIRTADSDGLARLGDRLLAADTIDDLFEP